KFLRSLIHDEGEHAVKALHAPAAPAVIRLENDLGVRRREKAIAEALELRAKLAIIVNATIEDERQPELAVHHRLLASAAETDDRAPRSPEGRLPSLPDAAAVGTAAPHALVHSLDGRHVGRLSVEAHFTGKSAHRYLLLLSSSRRAGRAVIARARCPSRRR